MAEIVVHVCPGCGREYATYKGALPRGWYVAPDGTAWCGRSREVLKHGSLCAIEQCLPDGARKVA